jgi:hypothetical protein
MSRLSTKAPLLVVCFVSLAAGISLSNATSVNPARADDAKPAHGQSMAGQGPDS